jgi:hypothetical protein
VPQASKDAQAEKDALTKIDAHLHEKISALTMPGEGLNVGGHALKIEPYVVKLKFVDGGTRFFAGAFAGSSAVVMQLKLIDEATNEVVAQPSSSSALQQWVVPGLSGERVTACLKGSPVSPQASCSRAQHPHSTSVVWRSSSKHVMGRRLLILTMPMWLNRPSSAQCSSCISLGSMPAS